MKTSPQGVAEIVGHEGSPLPIAELRRRLSYDPDTGEFRWRRASGNNSRAGDVAGTVGNAGYRIIALHRTRYVAHRLAWAMVYDEWPPDQLDHINGDRGDNRISNLRRATNAENMRNTRRFSNNTSGFKGVSARRGRWRATITKDYRQIYLGDFDSAEKAHAAYAQAATDLFGDYARTS